MLAEPTSIALQHRRCTVDAMNLFCLFFGGVVDLYMMTWLLDVS